MNSTNGNRWSNSLGDSHDNKERLQRWGALVGGGALAALGLSRRSKSGFALAAAGGALAYAGIRSQQKPRNADVGSSIVVNASPEETYRFYRDLENLPRFMNHLESVTLLGDRRSKWVAAGPFGAKIQWTAEITDELEGQYIVWRSLPGSDISVNGSVEFRPAVGKRGTVVESHMQYSVAKGGLSQAASFAARQSSFFLRQDLRRLKALIETGEIPTTDGQSHGPRSRVDAVARIVNPDRKVPDRKVRGEASGPELVEAQRRVS